LHYTNRYNAGGSINKARLSKSRTTGVAAFIERVKVPVSKGVGVAGTVDGAGVDGASDWQPRQAWVEKGNADEKRRGCRLSTNTLHNSPRKRQNGHSESPCRCETGVLPFPSLAPSIDSADVLVGQGRRAIHAVRSKLSLEEGIPTAKVRKSETKCFRGFLP